MEEIDIATELPELAEMGIISGHCNAATKDEAMQMARFAVERVKKWYEKRGQCPAVNSTLADIL